MIKTREIDDYGRVTLGIGDLFEVLYAGGTVTSTYVRDGDATRTYNEICVARGKDAYCAKLPEKINHSPEEEHAKRASTWLIPEEFGEIDVREYILSLCERPDEFSRVEHEMKLFEERGMLPILRLMIYLVAHFRDQKVVWGVGRGSSVASYVLYKIGVHKIDSIKYGLDIREFIKDAA